VTPEPRHPPEEALPRFSLGRPVTVAVLVASVVVVGIVAALGIPLELIPSGFTNPFLVVRVPWRDAPAREVLDKIVVPLEDELSTVRGLDTMRSVAVTGFARVFLQFKPGTDMDVAYREVRDRVQRARARLPDDADRVYIRKEDESGIPVFVLGLAIDPGLLDPYDLIQNTIMLHLERLDGVASVDSQGLVEKEILIELDRQRVEAAGLDIYRIARQLRRDNFTMASGEVYDGGRKLLLRSVARYRTVEDLERRLVAPGVRLGDIARVRYDQPETEWSVRVNGRPAVAVIVLKEGQANALEVCRRIRAEVRRLEADPRLQLISMMPIFDQGKVIEESLDTLLDSGRVGALFAALVLFFFLRRVRMTVIVTLAIPLSILVALIVMFFAGESLNVISMLGLMISVGLLVDNAVVVAENIHRLHEEGHPRRRAVIRGTAEIALAITMATLTTIVVFLPVSLVQGQGQFFLLRLSIPISVSLLASLGVAGVVVPLAVYLTLDDARRGRPPHPAWRAVTRFLEAAYDRTLAPVNRGYGRLLAVFLRHRLDLALLLAAVLAVSFAVAFQKVHIVETQEEERSGFDIRVRLPERTTFEEASAFFRECESRVEALKEELDLSGYFVFHRKTFGRIQAWFNNPRTDREITPRIATERILEALPKRPGVRYFTGERSEAQDRRTASELTVTLYGEDPDRLERVAADVEELLLRIPGVLGLKSSGEPPPSELELVVDRRRAQELDVNPAVIAGLVGYALRGQQLPYYRSGGREIPVRVRFEEADREGLAQLRSFRVPTGDGSFVPLDALTRVRFSHGAQRIRRENKRVAHAITLDLEPGREMEARRGVAAALARLDLPEGITLGNLPAGGPASEEVEALKLAGMLSVVFVYLLMGFLFESFILPLAVLLTIPLATIGVGWIHYLAGLDVDVLGVVGAVLLIGVVVNNGIVLIDAVNRLRLEGLDRTEAILLAARRRFRPIMMTALTTIFGLIPVTLSGTTSIGLSYTSFGLTLIGGLTTSTALTLLVVPVFYTLFDDAREVVLAMARRALRRTPAASTASRR